MKRRMEEKTRKMECRTWKLEEMILTPMCKIDVGLDNLISHCMVQYSVFGFVSGSWRGQCCLPCVKITVSQDSFISNYMVQYLAVWITIWKLEKMTSYTCITLLCAKGSLIFHGMVCVTYPMNATYSKIIGPFQLYVCTEETVTPAMQHWMYCKCNRILCYRDWLFHYHLYNLFGSSTLVKNWDSNTVWWLPTVVIMWLRTCHVQTDSCIMNLAWGDQNIVAHSGSPCFHAFSLVTVNCVLKNNMGPPNVTVCYLTNQHV